MAMEPINLFASRVDLPAVAAALRKTSKDFGAAAKVELDGPDDGWLEAVATVKVGRRTLRLDVHHDPNYYAGPDWPLQRRGMVGYFSRFPAAPLQAEVFRLIGTFQFALATRWKPDITGDDDPRLAFLYAVAQALDGVFFTPSALRDAAGRTLLAADGAVDPQAMLPAFPAPATPQRAARRALLLAAVAARGLLEREAPQEPQAAELLQECIGWVAAAGIEEEFEPHERETLHAPLGTLDLQRNLDAVWRLEGLAVLAWALGRYELPPYDELVVPMDLLKAVGFRDEAPAKSLLAHPTLRPPEELEKFRKQCLGVHWRLREFSVRPKPVDFVKFARECWFAPMPLDGVRLVEGDLALGDAPVSKAPPERFGAAYSAALERHTASNWLHRAGVYSETDQST